MDSRPDLRLDVRLHELVAAGALCVTCATGRLACAKRDTIAATYTLIEQGAVRCEFAVCASCALLELIIRPRARS